LYPAVASSGPNWWHVLQAIAVVSPVVRGGAGSTLEDDIYIAFLPWLLLRYAVVDVDAHTGRMKYQYPSVKDTPERLNDIRYVRVAGLDTAAGATFDPVIADVLLY
jgi:hypothetical protein